MTTDLKFSNQNPVCFNNRDLVRGLEPFTAAIFVLLFSIFDTIINVG